jgi:hypothetical protein
LALCRCPPAPAELGAKLVEGQSHYVVIAAVDAGNERGCGPYSSASSAGYSATEIFNIKIFEVATTLNTETAGFVHRLMMR